MNGLIVVIKCLVSVSVLLAAVPTIGIAHGPPLKNVLILNSYHCGFSWSDDEEDAVARQLVDTHLSVQVMVEYLDAKRNPGKINLDRMTNFLMGKYGGKQIDLIIALDDAAVDMLTANHTALFPDAPAVFAGITSFKKYADRGRNRITGVLESQDIKKTIDTAIRLFPNTREILSISDMTVSGISARRATEAILPGYDGRLTIRFLPACTFEAARVAVAALPEESIVLLNTYTTDSSGKTLSTEESTHLIASSASVPVFGVHQNRLGDGIVGGYLLNGRAHGRKAAAMGLRILAGEDPDAIAIDKNGSSLAMFDYEQMKRFGIPSSKLPKGSIVINKPQSVFDTHPKFATTITITAILLVISLLMLVFFIVRLLQTKSALWKKTQEIDRIFSLSIDLLCVAGLDGRFKRMNPAWENTLGYSLDELTGMVVVDLVHPDDIEATHTAIAQLSAGKTVIDFTNRYRCKDGSYRYLEWRSKPYQKTLIYSVARDITERKQSDENLQHLSQVWKLAQEMANIGHWSFNLETQKPVWSDQMFMILGCDPEKGVPNYEAHKRIIHPDDWEIFDKAVQRSKKGTPYDIEIRTIFPDGSIHWFNAQGFPRCDQYGRITELFGTTQDITERKQMEETLRLTQYAIDKTIDQAFWTNEDGSIFYVNDSACRTLGYSREELLTLSLPDIAPTFLPEVFAEYWRNLQENGSATFESLHRAKDGRVYPVEVRANYLVFDGKKYNCTFATDISERQKSASALAERRKELEVLHRLSVIALSEHALDIVLHEMVRHLSDALDFPIVAIEFYHEAQQEMEFAATVGIPTPPNRSSLRVPIAETLSGVVVQTGQPMVETHALDRPEYTFEVLRSLGVQTFVCVPMLSGRRAIGTLSMGSPKPLSIGESFVSLAGSLANFIAFVIRHKRALQESEAKMHGIMNNIGIGMALINPEMKILELNKRMREWFPDIDPEQCPTCYRAFNNPPREKVCDYCPTCKTLQDGRVHEATTQTPQPGGMRNFRVVSSPVFDQSGQVKAVIEMVDDITEKLAMESQLRQAQKMESVGRLAGGVAHDFNNMLSVILGYGELALEQSNLFPELDAALQEIMKAARRSADITRQLLAFARQQTISPKVISINRTVAGMTSMLQRLIGEDIDLVWLPGETVWPVMIDPTQVDQILANLCVNARDAIADVGNVTIETGNDEFDEAYCKDHLGFRPGEYVFLAVSDNGCGMGAETLDKIFDPFFTTKESGRGTGLGLATVYGIVKQNAGFVNVYSEPDHGTTIKIYLPRHSPLRDELTTSGPDQPVNGGHETILLVEDELAILRLAKMMLENMGYNVVAAGTTGEAIALVREHAGEIHLLLTDVVMPKMNGRDLAKTLVSFHPNLKCLFMSGYTANVIAHHGVLDEGVHFITKPFSKATLGAKIREVLDNDDA